MKIYIILILLIFAGIKAGSQSLEINGEGVKKIEFKKNLTMNIKTNHIVALKDSISTTNYFNLHSRCP